MKNSHKKGYGNIFAKKDGTLYCRWTINGHTFTKSAHTKDIRKAERLLRELTAASRDERDNEILAHKYIKMAKTLRGDNGQSITIADAFKEYLDSPNIKEIGESTITSYKSYYNTFSKFMAENSVKHLDEIEDATATSYAKYLSNERGISNNTYNKTITFLSKLYRTILPNNVNPFSKIALKQVVKNTRRELSPMEVNAILKACEGTEYHTLILIGLFTGLRLGDCANLTWDNIDFTNNLISITPRKTRHSSNIRVNIPIHPILREALNSAHAEACPFVLPTINNQYQTAPARLSRTISAIFESVGIMTNHQVAGCKNKSPLATFHSIRHTFCSAIMNSNHNIPVGVAQALLGHSTVAMTLRYTHTNINSLKEAVEAIAM